MYACMSWVCECADSLTRAQDSVSSHTHTHLSDVSPENMPGGSAVR